MGETEYGTEREKEKISYCSVRTYINILHLTKVEGRVYWLIQIFRNDAMKHERPSFKWGSVFNAYQIKLTVCARCSTLVDDPVLSIRQYSSHMVDISFITRRDIPLSLSLAAGTDNFLSLTTASTGLASVRTGSWALACHAPPDYLTRRLPP